MSNLSKTTLVLRLRAFGEKYPPHNFLNTNRQFYLVGEEVKRWMKWLIKRLIKVAEKVAYLGRKWYAHVAWAFPVARHYRAVFV